MKLFQLVALAAIVTALWAGQVPASRAQEVTDKTTPALVSTDANKVAKDGQSAVAQHGASEAIARAKRDLTALKKSLADIHGKITAPDATVESLVVLRKQIDELRIAGLQARDKLATPLRDIGAQLSELGPGPKKGETEVASIAAKRKNLSEVFGLLSAAQKQFDLLDVEAGQTAALTTKLQREAFAKRVFVSRKSVLNPQLWLDFAPTIGVFYKRAASIFRTWRQTNSKDALLSGNSSLLVVMALFSAALAALVGIWKKMSNPPASLQSSNNLKRIWRAVGGVFLVAIVNFSLFAAVPRVVEWANVADLRVERLVLLCCRVLFLVSVGITVLRAVVSPVDAQWRLCNLDDASARRFYRIASVAIVVLGAGWLYDEVASFTFLPFEFTIGSKALITMVLVALVAVLLSTARNSQSVAFDEQQDPSRLFYFGWTSRLFLGFWLLLVAGIAALLFGYIALAYFLVTNLVLTSGLVVGLYLVHHLVDALVDNSMKPWSRVGKLVRQQAGFGEDTINRVGLLFSTVTDVSVVIIGISLILALLAITWIDLSSLMLQVFKGFKIGEIAIQPDRILLGIVIFVVGLVVVRLFGYWIERRILARSRLDAGIQNSVATGAKYTGLILVGGFALSASGLDFSKLAIVAGALSVGIGFGLQSVVSNFVSGLILLAERPIRIGDWIEVGSGEGTVKKINVRSTEIETFDRCKVIIPNSSFISDPVKNWSHGSSVGRIKVNVGVSYDSDPDQVKDILLACADAHPEIVSSPPPRVMFQEFGASSLDFQLRVFLRDIGDCTIVGSDLRFAIFREFAKAGIEIPFPQNDIHIRDVDKVANAFNARQTVGPAKKTARKPARKTAKK